MHNIEANRPYVNLLTTLYRVQPHSPCTFSHNWGGRYNSEYNSEYMSSEKKPPLRSTMSQHRLETTRVTSMTNSIIYFACLSCWVTSHDQRSYVFFFLSQRAHELFGVRTQHPSFFYTFRAQEPQSHAIHLLNGRSRDEGSCKAFSWLPICPKLLSTVANQWK